MQFEAVSGKFRILEEEVYESQELGIGYSSRSGADGGTPATVEEATEKLREKFADDEHDVTWINVVAKEEPGTFRAFIDVVKKGDPATNETKMCNATIMSNSSNWNCQAAKPGMMTQAANMLIKDYEKRRIEVRSWHLERTGKDNEFAGYFELVDPRNGQTLKIPCKGDQIEGDYDIKCQQS